MNRWIKMICGFGIAFVLFNAVTQGAWAETEEHKVKVGYQPFPVQSKSTNPTTVIDIPVGQHANTGQPGSNNPTDPNTPNGPGGGTDPNTPNGPGGGNDPNTPNGPGGGTDPNTPNGPGGGTDPNTPNGPGGGNDPNTPNGPGGGTDPNTPNGPGGGTDPNTPNGPGGGTDPNAPNGPGGGNDPNTPNGPGGGTDPNTPNGPGGGNDPNTPNGPGGGNDPNTPNGPGGGNDPNTPNGPGGVDDPNSPDGSSSDGDSGDKKSWWDRIKEGATNFWDEHSDTIKDIFIKTVRGIVVGAIGALIVVGLVVGVGLLLGSAVAVPVLLVAAAVGIVAGVVYSFVSGNSFSMLEGIAWSGLATLVVIVLAEAGFVTLVRGAWQGMRGFASGLRSNPLLTLKKTFLTAENTYSFGINFGWNAIDGTLEIVSGKKKFSWATPFQWIGAAAVSALFVDRFGKFLGRNLKTDGAKAAATAVTSTIDTFQGNIIQKKEHDPYTYLGGGGAALTTKQFFSWFATINRRQKMKVGTTMEELRDLQVVPMVGGKKKKHSSVTNKELFDLWQASPDKANDIIAKMQRKGYKITQWQMNKLNEYTKTFEKKIMPADKYLDIPNKIIEKEAGTVLEFVDKELINNSSVENPTTNGSMLQAK